MSNPLKAQLFFPRVHEACYLGHCVKFESRANIDSPFGFNQLLYEGRKALRAAGIETETNPFKDSWSGITIDGR